MVNDEQKNKFTPFIIIALVCFAVGWASCSFSGSSNGGGDKIIIEQQKQILANQRDFTTKLDGLAKTTAENNRGLEKVTREVTAVRIGLGGIADEVQQVTAGLRSNDPLLEEARRLDTEDERALRAILERYEKQSKTGKN